MAAKKKPTAIEWVGGLIAMPGYVTDEGARYRPEALFWIGGEGAVLGHLVGKPGELIAQAAESLQYAIERPLVGRSHTPQRLRVASPELAAALRAGHAGIEVVCAPTPELDELVAGLREQMTQDAEVEAERSYLSPGIDPEAIGALFRAAAGLFRVEPWRLVPSDQSLISVTIEQLGIRDAVVSVIGQMGQSLGFIVFSNLDDFDTYLDAAEDAEHGDESELPHHFSLTFERKVELGPALCKEIVQHRWEVAGDNAYPLPLAIDDDMGAPLTADEVTIAEALARALPELLADAAAVLAGWQGGAPVERTLEVSTHAGPLEIRLRIPPERPPGRFAPPYDVLADLFDLAQSDELEPEERRPLEAELVHRFLAAPEAAALSDVHTCNLLMDLAADHLGATIATLSAPQLRELLLEIIPRKVSIEASSAAGLIADIRAFYTFLKRAFGLKQADACLRVLAGDAVQKLEAALSDSRNFGMAKSMVMGGREAGFDVNTREGLDAWMRVMQSRPLPASVRLPSPGAPRGAAKPNDRAKKAQRKAARKARKKSR